MAEASNAKARPRFGIGAVVRHVHFGKGRILGYEDDTYVMLFRGGETKRVAFSFEGLAAEDSSGDAELDRIRHAVREVLGDHGWVDVELELGKRWVGGTLKMVPGVEGTQPKDVPIEAFFKSSACSSRRSRAIRPSRPRRSWTSWATSPAVTGA
jgi:hypothetical protein